MLQTVLGLGFREGGFVHLGGFAAPEPQIESRGLRVYRVEGLRVFRLRASSTIKAPLHERFLERCGAD